MKRTASVMTIAVICCLGQQAMAAGLSKPPELRVLERFVGIWDCEVVIKPAVWTPKEKREKSVEVNEMSLDGWFLHGSSKTVDGKTNAILLNTYDPTRKNYRIWRFVPGGSCEEMRGEWDEAAATLTIRTNLEQGITQTAVFHLIDKDHREYHVVAKDAEGKAYLDVQGTVTRRKSPAAGAIEQDGNTQSTQKSNEDHVPAKPGSTAD